MRTAMDAYLYHVNFVGGPSDGLVIQTTRATFDSKLTLTLAVSPATTECDRMGSCDAADRARCTYRRTSRQVCEEGGQPTIHLRYDFLKFETPDREAGDQTPDVASQGWLARGRAIGRRAGNKLLAWMLEPIDYPLKLTNPLPLRRKAPRSVEQARLG